MKNSAIPQPVKPLDRRPPLILSSEVPYKATAATHDNVHSVPARRRWRAGISLTEAMLAVLLFGIMCVPLFRLYFKEGLSQQRMIRDFLAVSNVTEKVLNRVDHQLGKLHRPLDPLWLDTIVPHIMIGLEESNDWGFLGQAFSDDSGHLALQYIPEFKADAILQNFQLDASAVSSDHRGNNPALLQEVLKSVNERAQMINVNMKWLDQAQIKHDFRLSYITTLWPEFQKAKTP